MISTQRRARLEALADERRAHDERDRQLTSRIRDEVLEAVDEGALHREIAAALGVSEVRVGQIVKAAQRG